LPGVSQRMTRVKICGCRSPEQASWAAEAGADFVGIVFAPRSRRRIDLKDASEVVRALGPSLQDLLQRSPPALYKTEADDLRSWFGHGASALERLLERKRPLTVGVFAGNDPDEINEIVEECGIDLIQLSGGEPWTTCLMANREVIKVLHVGEGDTAGSVLSRMHAGSALAVLLDRAADNSPGGGTGQKLDWRMASDITAELPVWLAGGLTPENVSDAVNNVRPWCVDVSSGVETKGVKDPQKVRAFVSRAKGA
jgi:anthranilate synthase / indole-3-glycerol phosphate synthase / phosphoribosylanthranilate isomerase